MEEEVEQEVEAMEAVYGSDCVILQTVPPHLYVSLKPRTAEDVSVQFVGAILEMKADKQYPETTPQLELKEVKGLNEQRQAKLLSDLHSAALELPRGPMLVAICEAALDFLTSINVPEGDCCFCMDSLVLEDGAQPFMKLMSCFHCFHSICFGKWWRWLQLQQSKRPTELEDGRAGLSNSGSSERAMTMGEEIEIRCPVCRIIIHMEDIAHVREYLLTGGGPEMEDENRPEDSQSFILTEEELARRHYFHAEFEAQQARGGIIELKKLEVIVPGMSLPLRSSLLDSNSVNEESLVTTGTSASIVELVQPDSARYQGCQIVQGQQDSEQVEYVESRAFVGRSASSPFVGRGRVNRRPRFAGRNRNEGSAGRSKGSQWQSRNGTCDSFHHTHENPKL